MPETIKRTISLKFNPTKKQKEQLDNLFEVFGQAVSHTTKHIQKIYDSYEDVELSKVKKCHDCKEEKPIKYKHKKLNHQICNSCFLRKWSIFTFTTRDKKTGVSYQDELIDNFPELSPAHKGYYSGVIKLAVPMFKSYLTKLQDRKKEIEMLRAQIIATTNVKYQLKLQKKLRFKEKGIKPMQFRKNVIYHGSAGMFELKEEEGKFWIGITNPYVEREKIWYELKIGQEKSYKTDHNKYKIIREAIKNKDYKTYFGKILKRDTGIYEFMFPKRDLSESLTTTKEIKKFYKKNPKTPLICLSFTIKKPILATTIVNGKIVDAKSFGDKSIWDWINHERDYRAKLMNNFANKYRSKRRRNKARKKFFKKRGMMEREFIKYNTHKLTTNVIKYLKAKNKTGIIVMRDTKGIKRINYPSIYRVVFDRWNIEMQKTMLEYKEMLKNFHIYTIPYNQTNNLKCGSCNKEFKVEKKHLKVLTLKLKHALRKESLLKHRFKMLKNKIFKLQKYPSNKENRLWIQQVNEEMSAVKSKLDEVNGVDNYKFVKCGKCGFTKPLNMNDTLQLYNQFKKEVKA